MIVVTGAVGFIASALIRKLNDEGHKDIIVVDDFSNQKKNKNLEKKSFLKKIHRNRFSEWLEKEHKEVEFIFHFGARTDTAEFNVKLLNRLNLDYSKTIWRICTQHCIPLVYASSAATYGAGECGYSDEHEIIYNLRPLNPYGISKNEFDKFVISQTDTPPFWAGLKFFNVFGSNEYHKKRMASVIFHAYNQAILYGKIKLFRSHLNEFGDGMQLRDFIYIKDVLNVCYFFMNSKHVSGIYNLGTGKARTFTDLANAVFKSLNKPPHIEFIDIPDDIRDKYQYYTQADIKKLEKTGCNTQFFSLEEGIADYILYYLNKNLYY